MKNTLKTPDTTALITADETFTYRQFDVAANKLANSLITHEIKPQSRIVLLLPRISIFKGFQSADIVETLKNFKLVVSGGEKYSKLILNKLKSITTSRLSNTYGSTEIADIVKRCCMNIERII